MNKMIPPVDGYVRKNKKWSEVLQQLRTVILDSPLTEEVKWRGPVYTFGDKNIVILGAVKEYCMLSYVKGVLLKDARGILQKPGENSQAVRVVRFTEVREIVEMEAVLKAYIQEAIEVEKAGLKVRLKKISEFTVPDELQNKLDQMPALKRAFEALTPGRRRGYLLYVAGAKQTATRAARVKKCVPRILKGKGFYDD